MRKQQRTDGGWTYHFTHPEQTVTERESCLGEELPEMLDWFHERVLPGLMVFRGVLAEIDPDSMYDAVPSALGDGVLTPDWFATRERNEFWSRETLAHQLREAFQCEIENDEP